MDIPRDVLIAGAKAVLDRMGVLPEDLDRVAGEWIDSTANIVVVGMVAAIEAWETRPHPWAPAPEVTYGTSGGVPVTDAVVKRLADEAERGYTVPAGVPVCPAIGEPCETPGPCALLGCARDQGKRS